MKLYRNGVLINSKTSTITALKSVSNNFEIGRYPNYSGIYANSSIDEVRVYNRALSEDEIRYLYNQKKPILHLKMNEGSGSYVKDESFNGNDGIIYGSWGVASSGGSNTLTATRNWTANEWTGGSIEIYEGTGIGQTRTIVSNTNNQVTVSSNWDTVPDNTSRYRIASRREWISGKNGSALSFDAVDDYVKINDSESLKLTKNITMEAWVYPVGKSGTTSWNRIISKDGTATGYVLGVRDGDNDGNLDSIVYRLNGAVYVPTVIDYNRWYHLAVAYDGANVRVYKDGKEIYSVAYTSAVNSGTSDLNIGHLFNNTDYFKGTIDDVRIYNYARTADEVKVDYNDGAAAHLGKNNQDLNYGLVGYWDMEEGGGQTVKDKSDNGNHGTLGYNLSAESQDPVFGSGYDSAGNNGTGIVLDGVDDLVEVDVNGGFNLPTGLSIGGWIKPSVASSQLKTGGWNYYSRGYWTTTPYEFGHWGNSNPSLKMYNSAGSSYSLSAGQPLAGDVWYHLFATVDPGTGAMKFYVNGVLKNSNTSFSGSLPGITSLVIGGGSSGCNFPGTIDEFRIYNRALSEDEILQLYNQKKPVLHFKMEEGSGDYAYDDSFNNNDGTLGGGTAANMPAWTQGKFGGGLSFDGNNDYIGVAHSNSLDITGKFTLEGWIYPTELNLEDCIFSKGGSSACGNYDLYLYNGRLALLSTSSCNWSYAGSNSSVSIGQWQHIAASYDGTNVNYYINGVLNDSKAWGGIGTVNTGTLEIGKQQSTAEGDFGGKMDDLRIYTYARTASEIRADYNAGLAAHMR